MGAGVLEATDGLARGLVQQAVTQVGGVEAALDPLRQSVLGTYDLTSQVAQFGLLPVGLSLLILHEQYQSATNNAPYRVGYVFVRFLAIVGLLLEYDLVVTLLTSVGSGKWGTADDFFGWVKNCKDVLMSHYEDVWDLPYFLFWAALFLFMILCSTLAYIVNTLLSISQGLLVILLLSVGKTCIAVSIVPGVGLGKSWARLLAMVAAWSGMAALIIALMKARSPGTAYGLWSAGHIPGILRLSAEYVVLAGFLGAVPWITAALFNGVAAMAPGVAGPLGHAISGGKMAFRQSTHAGGAALQGIRRRLPGGGGSASPPSREPLRAGKVPRAPLGGSADHVDFGSRHLSGKAAREHARAARARDARTRAERAREDSGFRSQGSGGSGALGSPLSAVSRRQEGRRPGPPTADRPPAGAETDAARADEPQRDRREAHADGAARAAVATSSGIAERTIGGVEDASGSPFGEAEEAGAEPAARPARSASAAGLERAAAKESLLSRDEDRRGGAPLPRASAARSAEATTIEGTVDETPTAERAPSPSPSRTTSAPPVSAPSPERTDAAAGSRRMEPGGGVSPEAAPHRAASSKDAPPAASAPPVEDRPREPSPPRAASVAPPHSRAEPSVGRTAQNAPAREAPVSRSLVASAPAPLRADHATSSRPAPTTRDSTSDSKPRASTPPK